jgi:HSP20 family protein
MLMRWHPFREMTKLQEEINRAFEGVGRRFMPGETNAMWTPAVDLFEDEGSYVLKAELPGLAKEDIELQLENRTLTLRGERKMEKEIKEENYHQLERNYGRFVRAFTLPTAVEEGKITANFKEGILEVVVPKAEDAKPKLISIG